MIQSKTSKYIVAFLNSLGGELFFGVDDDGRVTGCSLSPAEKAQATRLVDGAAQRCDPMLEFDAVQHVFIPVLDENEDELASTRDSMERRRTYVLVVRVRRGSREPVYYLSADSMETWIRRSESVFRMSRELQWSREAEFTERHGGSLRTRTWRHLASRALPFEEHAAALRRASGEGRARSPRRWFWRELLAALGGAEQPAGQLVLVVGASGSGKSTLMATLVESGRARGHAERARRVSVLDAHFCQAHAPALTHHFKTNRRPRKTLFY